MSEEPEKIYSAIPAILADMPHIGKDSKNQQQGFPYRSVDAVYNAVHPLLAKHKVFITTEVLDEKREERTNQRGTLLFYVRLKCQFTFYTTDGSNVKSVIIGEAMDSGDKATNKAMSIAFKYALFQLLCIPTEETAIDPDATTHEDTEQPPKKEESNKQAEATQLQREFTARMVMKAATMKPESIATAIEYAESKKRELGDDGIVKVRSAICEMIEKHLLAAMKKAKYKAEVIDLQTEFMNPFHHLLSTDELNKLDAVCNDLYAKLPAGDN